MYVQKRNGLREAVHFDKITSRISRLCYGLDARFVEPVEVSKKVCMGVYAGVTTTELDELAAETAAHLTSIHPDYEVLAARIAVSNHHKRTPKSFSKVASLLYEYVDLKTGKPAPMLSKEVYTFIQTHANALDSAIVYDRDYGYDYFGFKTLQYSYLLKVDGQIIERPQHMIMRVACGLHCNDLAACLETYNLMSQRWFTHATPTLFNSGTPNPQMSSCFLLSLSAETDSIEGIYDTLKSCALISKHAGGIGLAVSDVRASGSYIRGTNGTSNGLVPMLRVYNNTARYVDQGGGKRKGAFAIYLEPWHADVEAVLELKKNHGAEEERARDLFYGLWVPDLFMRRVEADEPWSLFCPNEAKGLTEAYGDEFDALYTGYENTPGKARKVMRARVLWQQILDSQQETGTPYMLHKDACNRKSNQKNLGTIKCSNLCVKGDTLVLTDKGHLPIKDLVGLPTRVWNGCQWSSVTPMLTGADQQLVRVELDNGGVLECTGYHKFYDQKGVEIRAQDLIPGTKLERGGWPIVDGSESMKYPYTHGLFCAEGHYEAANIRETATDNRCSFKASQNGCCMRHQGSHSHVDPTVDDQPTRCRYLLVDRPAIRLYGKKMALIDHLDIPQHWKAKNHLEMGGTRSRVPLPEDIAPKFKVPVNAGIATKIRWLEGFLDGDGTVCRQGQSISIQATSVEKVFINDVRLMLQTLGISVKIGLGNPRQARDIKGTTYECMDLWRICISNSDVLRLTALGFSPKRLDLTGLVEPQREAKRFPVVVSVKPVDGLHDTFCFDEPLRHRGVFNGVLSGQCSEIVQYTSKEEIAVCNLASIALPMFVEGLKFNFKKLFEVAKVVTRNLNRVIDINYYPVPQAERSNRRHRPIGLGVQGLADTYILMRLPYDSDGAQRLNKQIFETIYFAALTASCELAERDGTYETYQDSPISRGDYQFDLWGKSWHDTAFPDDEAWDWLGLMKRIEQHGVRNSLLVAPMPTATTSQILGNTESFEPISSNMYVRRTLAGEFVCLNRHLVKDLIRLGVWSKELKDKIVAADGSVQNITEIPAVIRELYKTVWEISQRTIIDMAADRGAYIDQSQSLNIHMTGVNAAKLTSMHFHAWKRGLKTGMYYLRTRAAVEAVKVTLAPAECSLANGPDCAMCGA